MSRELKLRALGSYPKAWAVISWARELVDNWGSEVHREDGELLDSLGKAVTDLDAWLDEPEPQRPIESFVCWSEGCHQEPLEDSDFCKDHQG